MIRRFLLLFFLLFLFSCREWRIPSPRDVPIEPIRSE